MSLKQIMSPVLVAAIAAGSLSSAASAHEWNRYSGGSRVHISQYSLDNGEHRYSREDDGDEGHHRHNRNLALGAFAAIAGLAIIANAGHHHDHDDDDDYNN